MIKLQIKRGILANLPTLAVGEFAFTTDVKNLYIGTSGGNYALTSAANIIINASGFTKNLDSSVTNVQALATAVDQLAAGGGGAIQRGSETRVAGLTTGASYTLPNSVSYRVGTNNLLVIWNDQTLTSGVHYNEVGSYNSTSTTVTFTFDLSINDLIQVIALPTTAIIYDGQITRGSVTLGSGVTASTNYTLPGGVSYKVGTNTLFVMHEEMTLIKGVHYTEVGTNGATSTTIQFTYNLLTGETVQAYAMNTIPVTTSAASSITFDNTTANLPNNPSNTQTAIEQTISKLSSGTGISFSNTTANLPNNPTNLQTAIEQTVASIPSAIAANPPTDYGRYQAEFGFDNAILSNCVLTNNTVNLNLSTTTITQDSSSSSYGAYGNFGVGQRLDSTFTMNMDVINSVDICHVSKTGTPPPMIVTIFDETSGTVLGSKSIAQSLITANNTYYTFTFDTPIYITRGHVIQIRQDLGGLGDASNFYLVGTYLTSSLQANAFMIRTTAGWTSKIDEVSQDLRYKITYETRSTSGSVIKTYTPADLDKWGNIKFTKTTPTNTTLTCHATNKVDITQNVGSGSLSCYGNLGVAQRLDATFTASMDMISYVEAYVSAKGGSPIQIRASIYDETTSTLLGSVTVPAANITTSAMNRFTFASPISITRGHVIQIRFDQNGLGDVTSYYYIGVQATNVQANAYVIQTTDAWTSKTDNTTWDLRYGISYLTILKSNISSIGDISDISVSTYPSINVLYILTRNSITDSTPTLSTPSVTWEGGSSKTGVLTVISDATLSQDAAVVNISIPTGYLYYKIISYTLGTDFGTSGRLVLTCNDDTSANYNGGSAIGIDLNTCLQNATNNVQSIVECSFNNNNLTAMKEFLISSAINTSGSTTSGIWRNVTNPITKITLTASAYNIKAGSRFILMGVK
jgi:hypothetical protein